MAPNTARQDDNVRIAKDSDGMSTLDRTRQGVFNRLHSLFAGHDEPRAKPLPHDDDQDSGDHASSLSQFASQVIGSFSRIGFASATTLVKVQEASLFREYIDDRDYLMEDTIRAVIKDNHGLLGERGTQAMIATLYDDLQHPPDSNLGGKHKFRTATGAGTSLLYPDMGAAGQYYARTVKPKTGCKTVLPDPDVLFDTLLARRAPKEHPTRVSSVLFYLATVIIHDIFRTDHKDFTKSKTSSYLDLAPLYGSNPDDLARMRTHIDGQLQPDCFDETRLLMLPPGSGILLIMFNRFHNHVAKQLITINENGRFTRPAEDASDRAKRAFDEEVFQTARLITCGLYVNIILLDYVRTILNLNRVDSDWHLDPRVEVPDGPAMGIGNQVSAEFNLVYRWHSTISVRDEKWTEDLFKQLFPGKSPEDLSFHDFRKTLMPLEREAESTPPVQRPFQDFVRVQDGPRKGHYPDQVLVKSITESSEDVANAYGPRMVPTVLKMVENLGIRQARAWNLATLNEFRKHFSLRPHETWSDITTDVETQTHLKNLYGHVDNVELYPGLAVEDAKKSFEPASGLCPGYTISRAILSDATTLVRADRFYTTSFHPRLLTNWGFAEAGFDTKVDNGCVLYKLFQVAFPDHLHDDSIYSHFPFTEAEEVRKIMRDQLKHKSHLYNLDLAKSTILHNDHVVDSEATAKAVLDNTSVFSLDLSLAIKLLLPHHKPSLQYNHSLSSLLQNGPSASKQISHELLTYMCSEFERDLQRHIDEKSYVFPKYRECDVVRDVIRKTSVRIAAKMFSVPSKDTDSSAPTESELGSLFDTVAATWSNFDRTRLTALRQKASTLVDGLRRKMGDVYHNAHKFNISATPYKRYHSDAIAAMDKAGLDADQAFAATILLASSFSTSISATFSEILEKVLNVDRSHLEKVRSLAQDGTAKADKGFNAYAHELARLSSEAVAVRIANRAIDIGSLKVAEGDRIIVSARLVNRDEKAYPSPEAVNLDREPSAYLPLDMTFGVNDPSWQELHRACLRSMLKEICRLPGLRPATVWDGKVRNAELKKVPVVRAMASTKYTQAVSAQDGVEAKQDSQYVYLTEDWDYFAPFPCNLKVNWNLSSSAK